jgi:hypothetical protein
MAAGLNTRPKPDRGPGVAHPFGDDYAIFDNQSGVSFVRDPSLLRNIRALPYPVEVGGVKDDPDPLRADYDGDLGDFGRVYLVPNAVAQVLAQVTCQDRKYPVRLLGKVDEPAKYVVSLPTSTLTFDALPGWKTHPAANIREWASKTHSPPALGPVTASHNPLCASQSDLGVKSKTVKTQNLHTERVVAAPAPVVAGGRTQVRCSTHSDSTSLTRLSQRLES